MDELSNKLKALAIVAEIDYVLDKHNYQFGMKDLSDKYIPVKDISLLVIPKDKSFKLDQICQIGKMKI